MKENKVEAIQGTAGLEAGEGTEQAEAIQGTEGLEAGKGTE